MAGEQLTIVTVPDAGPDCQVLCFRGPLTLATLFGAQAELRAQRAATLVLDLSEVPYVDSAGLGCLVNTYVSCQAHARRFALAGVNERLASLLTITKLDTVLPRYADWKQALASGSAESGTPGANPAGVQPSDG